MLRLICGPPRSGTTLLNGMISGGDAYPMISECSLITSIIENRLRYCVAEDEKRLRPYVRDDELMDIFYRDFIERIIANLISGFPEPRSYLVLKDPHLTLVMRDLHRFFVRPIRTLCMIRDPRDVVASLAMVMKRTAGSYDIGQAINAILPFYNAIDVALDGAHPLNPTLLVRYEDVVFQEKEALESLQRFCGYDIAPAHYREMTTWSFDDKSPWFVPTYGQGVTAERVGGFRATLSSEDVDRIQMAFAATMARHGYRSGADQPRSAVVESTGPIEEPFCPRGEPT